MNTRLLVVGLLFAVGVIEAKSTYSRHKILRQLSTHCEEGKSKCPNSDTCIRDSWFCDGDNDCGDDSDEPSSCPPRECSGNTFKCVTRNRCLPPSAVCDGDNDCIDNSDEPENCATRVCPTGSLRCNSGQCLGRDEYCTAIACRDRSVPQVVCPEPTCESGYSACPHRTICIRNSWICDGDDDCRDGSDEANCGHQPTPSHESHGLGPGGEDPKTMDCLVATGPRLQQMCGPSPSYGMFERTNSSQTLQILSQTDLGELCGPIQTWYACVENVFAEWCTGISHPMIEELPQLIIAGRTALDFVCVQNFDAINRNKACLLRENVVSRNPVLNIQLVQTAMPRCENLTRRPQNNNPVCAITPELQECFKHVVAEQCGDEIAEVLIELSDSLRQGADCSAVAPYGPPPMKRRGFPFDIKSFRLFF